MKKMVMSLFIAIVLSTIIPTSLQAREYRVEAGDNLWRIARDYQTSVVKLYRLNKLDSDLIFPGQVLKVQEEEIEENEEEVVHQIERGDTLYALSRKYDVQVDEIMKWNNLNSDLIIIGRELVIYPNAEAVDGQTNTAAVPSNTGQTESTKQVKGRTTKTMTATAYTAECKGCTGITYTGLNLLEDRHKKVIAVDPTVIPLGTRVYVEGYGEAIAGDIGSAIKGNRIDIHLPTKAEAFTWGIRDVEVTILE